MRWRPAALFLPLLPLCALSFALSAPRPTAEGVPVDVELVDFWHPDKATDLGPFFKMVGALGKSRLDLAEPLKQRMSAMSNNAKFAGGTEPL